MSTNLLALRAQTDAGSAEQKRLAEKKKSILLLIYEYLNESGFIESAKKLAGESSGLMSKFAAADNVDLMLILSEYEAYYEMRFSKKPKLMRKLADGEEGYVPRIPDSSGMASKKKPVKQESGSGNEKLPLLPGTQANNNNNNNSDTENYLSSLGVQGTSVTAGSSKSKRSDSDSNDALDERLLYAVYMYIFTSTNSFTSHHLKIGYSNLLLNLAVIQK